MYRLTKLSAALLLAGFAGAASAGWNQLDLNQPSNLDEQENVVYQGSFNYNGQTYGPSTAVAAPTQASAAIASVFDLNALQAFTLYGKNGPGGTGHNDDLSLTSNDDSSAAGVKTPVVYRIYRQNYSAATVNLARGTEGRHFVKHIIGEQTAPGTLVNGTYNYAGVTFSNFPRGMFDYQVTVTGPSAATGEGSFSLNEIKIPARISSTGKNIVFDITNGKLDPAALATTSNGLVFAGRRNDYGKRRQQFEGVGRNRWPRCRPHVQPDPVRPQRRGNRRHHHRPAGAHRRRSRHRRQAVNAVAKPGQGFLFNRHQSHLYFYLNIRHP